MLRRAILRRKFLDTTGNDPSLTCIDALLEAIDADRSYSIYVYSATYERGVLQGLAQRHPVHAAALPIWREIVDHLHANQPSRAPRVPAGVVQREVVFAPVVEPARKEWFVVGTESSTKITTISMPTAEAGPRVLSPADGTVIAPDPDIPAARQSMLVRAEAPQAMRMCLKLGARSLAPCGVREALVKLTAPGRASDPAGNGRWRVAGAGYR